VVDVVLPVLDEREALPAVLAAMPAGFRPLVVDNGSTDGSAGVAARLGATVVHEPRRGFGAACHAGLMAAGSPVVCFMDCDGSLDPGELAAVAGPVTAGVADLVLGARCAEPGAFPAHARLANRLLAVEVRRRTGVRVRDIGPMRAARRGALVDLAIEDRRFGWPLEMVMRAAQADWRIREVDVGYRPRIGRSKVTGTVPGVLRTVRDMTAVLR
jgi:glycosyltransferase involved in cell wall biosynthesis